mmetsp:Transcript_9347/g.34989  ORF Transcript_9347/g.34989 Transcript_9347/m.34989 type:complete len:281 (-) Transcript_9347:832-1674(-)
MPYPSCCWCPSSSTSLKSPHSSAACCSGGSGVFSTVLKSPHSSSSVGCAIVPDLPSSKLKSLGASLLSAVVSPNAAKSANADAAGGDSSSSGVSDATEFPAGASFSASFLCRPIFGLNLPSAFRLKRLAGRFDAFSGGPDPNPSKFFSCAFSFACRAASRSAASFACRSAFRASSMGSATVYTPRKGSSPFCTLSIQLINSIMPARSSGSLVNNRCTISQKSREKPRPTGKVKWPFRMFNVSTPSVAFSNGPFAKAMAKRRQPKDQQSVFSDTVHSLGVS